MADILCVIYDPPSVGLPPLVVVLGTNNEILSAQAASSLRAAEALQDATMVAYRASDHSQNCKFDPHSDRDAQTGRII